MEYQPPRLNKVMEDSMEAKDTVMSNSKIEELKDTLTEIVASALSDNDIADRVDEILTIVKKEAEISFRAGAIEGYQTGFLDGAKVDRKAGKREVVEWINKHLRESPACSYDFCFGGKAWRAKRKEWGIASPASPEQ